MKYEDMMLNIPDEDKCCINCEYNRGHTDGGDEHLCRGTMPCLNYHKDNTENFFVPDDDYLMDHFGCSICRHHAEFEEEVPSECLMCSRYYSDMWERSDLS